MVFFYMNRSTTSQFTWSFLWWLSYTYVERHQQTFHQQIASHRPPLWPLHSLHDRGEELWLEYYQKEENNFFRCRRWSLDLLLLLLSMLKMKPGCALTIGILSPLGLADILILMEESLGWLCVGKIIWCIQIAFFHPLAIGFLVSVRHMYNNR